MALKEEIGEIRETVQEGEENENKDQQEKEDEEYPPRRMERSATVIDRAPQMDSLIAEPAMDKD